MPTARPRHVITETDPVARALDAAAKRWPEGRDQRTKLVVHLLEGDRAITKDASDKAAARRDALRRTSALLSGAYGPRYLEELREDWPE